MKFMMPIPLMAQYRIIFQKGEIVSQLDLIITFIMQSGVGIVIDREQSRKSIVIRKLNELWQYSKFLYILVFLILFLIAIAVIICVLQTVIAHSKRYYYLQMREAEEFKKFLRLRHFKNSIQNFNGQIAKPHR